MCPDKKKYKYFKSYYSSQGFGLPVALFVITVLALIIASMSVIQRIGSDGISIQIQNQRAFYSAESGVQIGLNLLFPPASGTGKDCSDSPFYQQNFSAPGLIGCHVAVECRSVSVNSETYYTLVSSGRCGQGKDLAQRKLEVMAK